MVVLIGLIIPLFNVERISRKSGNVVTQHAVNTGLKIHQGLSKSSVSYIISGKLMGAQQRFQFELLKIYERAQWALPFYSSRLGLEYHMIVSGMNIDATNTDLENLAINIVLEQVSTPGKVELITSTLTNLVPYLTTPDPATGLTPVEYMKTIDSVPRNISEPLGIAFNAITSSLILQVIT